MKLWSVMLAICLVCPALHAASPQSPLKLVDGRIFHDWVITSETATAVFVKYKGGGAKVAKKLLPPDLQKIYRVDEAAAKAEAERLAASERAGVERMAEVAARKQDESIKEAAKAQRAAEAAQLERERYLVSTRPSPPASVNITPVTPAQVADPFEAAARTRAENYFRYEIREGSGAITATGVTVELDEAEDIPGWHDRKFYRGKGYVEFYDSKGSFQRSSRTFTVEVQLKKSRPTVVSFTPL